MLSNQLHSHPYSLHTHMDLLHTYYVPSMLADRYALPPTYPKELNRNPTTPNSSNS